MNCSHASQFLLRRGDLVAPLIGGPSLNGRVAITPRSKEGQVHYYQTDAPPGN